jgi:predicted outer membrane repeat protein
MKRTSLLLCWLLISQLAAFSQILIQDTVYWDTSHYVMVDNVVVGSTGCLIIEAGTHVHTDAQYYIEVYGNLQALGEVGDSVFFNGMNAAGTLYGGGIRIQHQGIATGDVAFQCCVFEYLGTHSLNPWDSLGAIAITGPGNTQFKGCRFENNSSLKNGGAIHLSYSNLEIHQSTFLVNQSEYYGGALYIATHDTVHIRDCLFFANQSRNHGGAIFSRLCPLWLEHNVFEGNKAINNAQGNYTLALGGGVYLKHNYGGVQLGYNVFRNNLSLAAVYLTTQASSLVNNLIHNNSGIGLMGGHSGSNNFYVNNTITRNEMYGIFAPSPNEMIVNCIVWMNGFANGYGQIMWLDTLPPWVINSCVSQGYLGPSIGLTTQDPHFVNPSQMSGNIVQAAATNWELQAGSSCVNTGLNTIPGFTLPLFDLNGNPRIVGPAIDIGAYEADLVTETFSEKDLRFQPYPNPVRDWLHLGISTESIAEVELTDLLGKRVLWQECQPGEALQMGHLPSGQYILRVRPEGEQPVLFKIIKIQ